MQMPINSDESLDPTSEAPENPTLINKRYRIVRKLGEGGMGSVSLVEDRLRDGQLLALKIIRSDPQNPMVLEILKNEFEALSALRHPNIASAFDYGTIEGKGEDFFTSEYVDGINFYDGTEDVSPDDKLDLLVQVARALEFVHSRGFIHHDLKPDNILLSGRRGNQTVKLIDFGLINREFLKSKSIIGTPHYMAPEKIRGMATDRRVDIYALGVVTYLLFTRRLPFLGTDAIKVVRKHLVEAPLPPRVHVPDLDEGLEEIILKLLAKDPADRYFSGSDIIRDVNRRLEKDFQVETAASQESYIVSGRFVGREEETKTLEEHLAVARSEQEPAGAAVLVRGKSGIGKSRLMREFRYHVQLRGVPYLGGSCSKAATTSLHPFYGIFRELIPLASQKLLERPDCRRELARLVPDMFPGEARQEKATGLRPGEDSLRLVHTLAEVGLGVAEQRPMVIYVNDLQWADEVSVDLFFTLARRIAGSRKGTGGPYRLLLVASFREEDLPGTPLQDSLDRQGGALDLTEINLASLEEDEVDRLVSSMFGTEDVPPLFTFHLHAESGGNPLFVEEVMKVLLEEGKVSRSGSTWVFPVILDDVRLPKTLEDVLLNRLRRIRGEEGNVLRFLSVLDRPAPADQIASLMGAQPPRLAGVLRSLERRQMLDAVAGAESVEYSFAHNQAKEVLYQNIEERARQTLHQQLGEGLEKLYSEQAPEKAVELAYHFLRSTERTRAIQYGMLAGQRLYTLHAYREGQTVYRQILKKLSGAEFATRVKILGRLADMAVLTGEYRDGIASLNRILDTGKTLLNWKSRGIALAKIADLHIRAGEPDDAILALEAGLQEVSPHGNTVERAHLLTTLGLAHLRKGNPSDCLDRCREAAEIAAAAGRGHSLPSIHNTAGIAHYGLGEYSEALEEYRESLEICRESKNDQGEGASHSNIGMVQLEQGQEEAARVSFQEAVRIFQEIGDRRSLALGQQNLADLHLTRGDLLSAVRHARKSLDISEEINDPVSLGKALIGYGQCLTALGDYDEAEKVITRAFEVARKVGDPREVCRALIASARLGAGWNPESGGRAEATEALKIARERGWPYLEGLSLIQLGDNASVEDADGIFRRLGARREMILSSLRKADYLIAAGDPLTSEPILVAAEGLAGPDPSPAIAMEIHRRRSLWLAMGEGGEDDLRRALEIARETSARPKFLEIAVDLIRILREKGDVDTSRDVASEALRVLDEMLERIPEKRRPSFLETPPLRLIREAARG